MSSRPERTHRRRSLRATKDCKRIAPYLHRLLDRELSTRASARVRAHVARCDECRRAYRKLCAQDRLLRESLALSESAGSALSNTNPDRSAQAPWFGRLMEKVGASVLKAVVLQSAQLLDFVAEDAACHSAGRVVESAQHSSAASAGEIRRQHTTAATSRPGGNEGCDQPWRPEAAQLQAEFCRLQRWLRPDVPIAADTNALAGMPIGSEFLGAVAEFLDRYELRAVLACEAVAPNIEFGSGAPDTQ